MAKAVVLKVLAKATGMDGAELAPLVTRTREREHGDWTLPCFQLAKRLQLSPPECAKKLAAELQLTPEISKVEPQGPYLNFFLERSWYAGQVLKDILQNGLGAAPARSETVVIDYSAPNIAKPFHIGHLRTTLIGHALYRILAFCGYRVVGVNHLGDWGTQFGFVYAGVKIWGKPAEESVDGLMDRYIQANILRKQQEEGSVPESDLDKPEINAIAREYFVRLENGESEAKQFWEWCLKLSMEYYLATYARLGIHFDHYTGESFYFGMLPDVERMLKESGILVDSEGALGVELGKPLGFARVFAEDGRSLYITRDIATAVYRWNTFHPAKILYVVGAPQKLHFAQLIAIMEKMRHPVAATMKHVAYGNVPGISTRKGGARHEFSLNRLITEAEELALETYRKEVEKRPEGLDEREVSHAIALGAIYFNYLCRSNIKDFRFTWEEALSFQGDTGPYLQYACARLYGIEAKAKAEGVAVDVNPDTTQLTDDEAHALIVHLSQFRETVEKAATEYEPYHVALYLLELAKLFSSAYRSLRVVGAEPQAAAARLALFRAVRETLRAGLPLIGIPVVDRM